MSSRCILTALPALHVCICCATGTRVFVCRTVFWWEGDLIFCVFISFLACIALFRPSSLWGILSQCVVCPLSSCFVLVLQSTRPGGVGLPENKPRYLMGVGYPVDIVVCVALGCDMFDCVYPCRTARFGTALVRLPGGGVLRIKQNKFKDDLR